MTFEIPDELGRRFRKAVPPGKRSTVVAEILRRKVHSSRPSFEALCHRVNKLKNLAKEMADWERCLTRLSG